MAATINAHHDRIKPATDDVKQRRIERTAHEGADPERIETVKAGRQMIENQGCMQKEQWSREPPPTRHQKKYICQDKVQQSVGE